MKDINHDEILTKIIEIVKSCLISLPSGEKITADLNIRDMGIDSIDFMEIAFKLEEEFDIEINERDLVNKKTIRDLASLINS